MRNYRWSLHAAIAVTVGVLAYLYLDRSWNPENQDPVQARANTEAVKKNTSDWQAAQAEVERAVAELFSETDLEGPVRTPVEPGAKNPTWDGFPRTDFSFPRRIVESPESLVAAQMFRHVDLNPTDTPLSKVSQATLRRLLMVRGPQLLKLRESISSLATAELDTLIRMGRARGLDFADYRRTLSADELARMDRDSETLRARLTARGHSPELVEATVANHVSFNPGKFFPPDVHTFRPQNGVFYFASLKELPLAKTATDSYHGAVMDLAGRILNEFLEHGCLNSPRSDKLLEQVSDLCF